MTKTILLVTFTKRFINTIEYQTIIISGNTKVTQSNTE
jgi:hypothetical protein